LIRQQITFGDALVGMKQAAIQLQVYQPGVSMPWFFYVTHIPQMLSLFLTVLLLLGIAWAVWKREWFGLHCLLVFVGLIVWFSCYRYKEVRIVTSALPFMAVLASVGLTKPLFSTFPSPRSYAILALVLGSIFVMNFTTTRMTFQHQVALGYPSFAQAMQFLREQTSPDAVLVGANYPQIYWYADRHAIDFPNEDKLQEILEQSEWVVVTNFERGQKSYVRKLITKVSHTDVQEGNVAIFDDSQFMTFVIRSSLLRKRL
jgi:hypothetical protein